MKAPEPCVSVHDNFEGKNLKKTNLPKKISLGKKTCSFDSLLKNIFQANSGGNKAFFYFLVFLSKKEKFASIGRAIMIFSVLEFITVFRRFD